jgi:plastocyanin
MKKIFILFIVILVAFNSKATIHTIQVWNGYYQFLPANLTIQLGDTIQWTPLDSPSEMHTITSTNIPASAATFDQIWQLPADTFFQYIPQIGGIYEYECTPHVAMNMIGTITVEGETSAENENNTTTSLIYPNPASNYIHFNALNTIEEYTIHAANGAILLSGNLEDKINISTFKNGMYFIKILGDKPKLIKIIKQ